MSHDDVDRLMELYPRIYFACHTRHVHDPTAERTLSAHQASILDHLDEMDPTQPGELARHMGVTASTMSIAIGRLVRQGYVRSRRDPDDRRCVLLTLTPEGVRLKSEKSVLDPARCARVLGRLGPAERSAALEGLALLAEASLEEMHARADEGRAPWRQPGRQT